MHKKDIPAHEKRKFFSQRKEKKCNYGTRTKFKILLKSAQIAAIENDNTLSDKEKIKKIKALFPNDKCVHNVIDYEYNVYHSGTRELQGRFG